MIIPHKLVHKLSNMGLTTSLCSWIMDQIRQSHILKPRPEYQLCCTAVCSVQPSSPMTAPTFISSKLESAFTDDTTTLRLITIDREEIHHLAGCCSNNNQVLKESTVEIRRSWKTSHYLLFVNGKKVDIEDNIKFL